MMASIKRPAFQFYPADWRKDPALRMCSVAARGLWMDMLCIMHESDRYGFLEVNGVQIDAPGLAKMVGEDVRLITDLLAELEKFGVFSRRNNAIFSRRMLRDEAIRAKRASAGKLGGNPKLLKQKVNPEVGPKDNFVSENCSKQKPTPSSSSSSSYNPPVVPPRGDDNHTNLDHGKGNGKAKPNRQRRSPVKPPPEEFELGDGHYAYARAKGLDEATTVAETEAFLTYHAAKGSMFCDWDRAWQNWIIRAAAIRAERGARR